MNIGDVFQGILILKISTDGKTINGLHLETGKKRTIHQDKDGWYIV